MHNGRMILLWLRVRQVPLAVVILLGMAMVNAAWGTRLIPLPTLSGLGGMVTLLWFYPIFAACAIATTLTSALPEQEAINAVRLDLRNRGLIAMLGIFAGAITMILTAITDGSHTAAQLLGGLGYWLGLAVVSAWIFGAAKNWVLPMVVFLPVTWWGFGSSPSLEDSAWWAIPAGNRGWPTLLSGLVFMIAAMGLTLVNRHHLRRLGLRW
jgi:Na+-transporting NADH:ubiquinone oxidoreductase subunit NqrE